jgi:hypothetical protein
MIGFDYLFSRSVATALLGGQDFEKPHNPAPRRNYLPADALLAAGNGSFPGQFFQRSQTRFQRFNVLVLFLQLIQKHRGK